MYPGYSGTRTVKTFYSDGSGPPRVETNTYSYGPGGGGGGGAGGINIGFTPEATGYGSGGGGGGGYPMSGFGSGGGGGYPMSNFSTDFNTRLGFDDRSGGGGGVGGTTRVTIPIHHGGTSPGGGGGGYTSSGFGGSPGFSSSSGFGGSGAGGTRPHTSSGGSPYRPASSSGGARPPSRPPPPKIGGRPQRSLQKNAFAGMKDQKIREIKSKCHRERILFEDPEFSLEENTQFYLKNTGRRCEWLRPSEITDNPEWISAGASRFDVRQGELGDCWLLAAVASLTCNQKLFNRVVPPDQNFKDDYCGVFRFNFWHQGEWTEVVVDDRLPTYQGRLVFMHSTQNNEYWSALLEKAYAKMMGSYEALRGGQTSEAMEDFTGGVTELFQLGREQPPNLLKIMLKAHERGALMGCSIDADPNRVEAELANGLIMGHAYSITAVRLLDMKTSRVQGKMPLVRVRNPWGNEAEWKGAWSDGSPEWRMVTEQQKRDLGLKKDDDGEFWMSFQDFTSNFQKLEVCNLSPDSLDDDDLSKKRWEVHKEHSSWVKRVSAGGCRNFLETFWTNPQFRMTLSDVDDDDDDNLCTAIIAVLQKDRRKKRNQGVDLLTIGYVIYKLDVVQVAPLEVDFFKYNQSVAKSPTFINMREVCGRHKLPPGTYCIVPSTFDPNQEGEFLVRIFTEKPNSSGGLDEDTRMADDVKKPLPSQEEQRQEVSLMETFRRIAGEDMEVDARELQSMLDGVFSREFNFPGFNIEAARSMVAMYDGDMSGKLGFDEFQELLTDLRHWKAVFKQFDKDRNGTLSSFELRTALNSTGFRLSNRTLQSLVMRYSTSDGKINFSDFITCSVRLKTMINTFKSVDTANQGLAPFTMENFLQTTMYS